MVYTENELNQMKKGELIKLVLEYQQITDEISKLSSKVEDLEHKFDEMQSINIVSKNTSDLLAKRVRNLETELLKANQYSRRECLDISGIDKNVDDDQVEEEVTKILSGIGIEIDKERDIQACHRYGSKNTVIVKFTNRKMVNSILSLKSTLSEDIFINESLCPRNKTIRGRCNLLKKKGKVTAIATRNGMIRIKLPNGNGYTNINHEDDLYDMFPDFEFDF